VDDGAKFVEVFFHLARASSVLELARGFRSSGLRGTASRAGSVACVAVVASPRDGATA
jgi:hypothetical protein